MLSLHSLHTVNDLYNGQRSALENGPDWISLWPAFFNGMLSAANPGTILIDGQENAYYYEDSRAYTTAYDTIRNKLDWLVEPDLRAKYRAQTQAGVAGYMAYPLGHWEDVGKWPLYARYKIPRDFRLQWLEHNLYQALLTTDEYVWLYSEQVDWWKPDGRTIAWGDVKYQARVPDGVAEAVRNARELIAQNKPLGYGMRYFDPKAPKMADAATVSLELKQARTTFAASDVISIHATPSSDAIYRVELFVDSVLIVRHDKPPFTFDVGELSSGKHLLFARGHYTGGHNTSQLVLIEVK